MLSPFFGLGDGIAALTGQPRDGFSRPYQVTAAAAGFVYALLGLALTASVLLRWFRPGTVVVTLLATTFGTGLFHYATYDSVYSHAFSFFLVAAVLRLTISVWERPRFTAVAALAAAAGLVALVRPPNLVVLIFSALIGVESLAGLRARGSALLRRIDLVAAGAGIFLIVVLPQLAYWHAITGHFIANGYPQDQRLDLLHPHLIGVLFSVRKASSSGAAAPLRGRRLPLLRRRASALLVPASRT